MYQLKNPFLQRLLLVAGFWTLASNADAQRSSGVIEARATLDTTMIMIGDHFTLQIDAEWKDSMFIQFPVFTGNVVDKIEVLRDLPFDTVVVNGKPFIRKRYKLTCFDSGNYVIDSLELLLRFKNRNPEKIVLNPIFLNVQTFQIDSTENRIADIKPPLDTPLTFKEFINEYLPQVLIIFGVLVLILFGLWFYNNRKQKPVPDEIKIPVEEAHIIALRELEELENEKLWQQGRTKEFYARLSTIVRKYMELRWNVLALESTTTDIRSMIKSINEIDKVLGQKLLEILETSDLVKFAKYEPLASENLKYLEDAYLFIRTTKKEPQLEDNPEQTESDNENPKNR